MPVLKTVKLTNKAINQVPSSFFTNSPRLESIGLILLVNSITIDNTINLPNLTDFNMISSCQNSIDCPINFTTQSFPKLKNIYFQSLSGSITINHDLNVPSSTISCIGNSFSNSKCHLLFGYPQQLVTISISGNGSTISPFPVIGDIYQSLVSFEMSDTGLDTYPIETSYPPKLERLNLNSNKISSVPSFPLPSSMTSLNYYNNSITDLDANTMFSANVSLVIFNMKDNPAFDDTITQAYCKAGLQALNTAITNLPDCLWCYYNYTTLIQTSVQSPTNFVCDYSINTPPNGLFISNQGYLTVTGINIGFGSYKPANYSMKPLIGNQMIQVYLTTPPLQPTNLTIQWGSVIDAVNNNNPPKSVLTILEAGINLVPIIKTKTYGFVEIKLFLSRFNAFLDHTWVLDNSQICTASDPTGGNINVICPTPRNDPGPYQLHVANPYVSRTYNFSIQYPSVANASPIPFYHGSIISLPGYYGPTFASPSVSILYGVGSVEPVSCQIQSISQYSLVIIAPLPLTQNGFYFNVTVDQTLSGQYGKMFSAQELCQQSTNNCHGNGQCNTTGQCVCKSNAYYFNCSKPYPIISSAYFNETNNKIISINGDFGPFGQSNLSIKINNTLDYTSAKNILYLRQPDNGGNNGTTTGSTTTTTDSTSTTGGPTTDTPQQQCEKQTSNCYGHGTCDMNGICQCQDNYNPDDNCFTKFINTTITPNTTSPTVSFDIDGIDFQFEVVSIQELDFDSNIAKELFISNYTWIVNASTNNITTIVDYQLNTTLKDNTTTDINSILFQSVSVLSTISFSTQSRDIQFGDQQLHINANSIKLSVNVTNWQYSSNLATLRVVFRTITINNQTVEYDCNEKEIDPLTYDSLSSLQYLRVIKDDIQFNGRFIDVALSDGRPTYSQTQLISLTQSSSNDEQSIALIGINLPQCQSCVLDPDFSPLLIDKSNDSGCGDSKSNTWRIIVGCVVGGVGALTITAAATIAIKKTQAKMRINKKMQMRLQSLN
ncbi:EGF-like protein [Cavenderia fasciculata]|uniref:EGF-like protein n=1 Tax=Cavenderia fasciculata TaxID=261658 RepID=F4Q839_CACFS|nr:EGF-like protein [Cavenderia fasciculata]EGG15939.1 EGF-like protein [Cavenderia fasciculata]|eukprot:XP_004352264.1 EGF-like protein [Cavenderia fasciculata]